MKQLVKTVGMIAVGTLLTATVAHAQATRTWVSGVGDDANPCSRTAPCKTFAGAISKTATNGEINVLDPGGFGGVTITKSITISAEGVEGGVLVSGTNAIIVNALVTSNIVLRGLDIEGLGTGLAGVRVLRAASVHVDNCVINNFTQFGIDFVPTATAASTSQLHVTNTIIRNNNGINSGGIRIKPGAFVTARGSISNTELRNNQVGLKVEDNSSITVTNTVAANNNTHGFFALGPTGASNLSLFGCTSTGHVAAGGSGIRAEGANAFVRSAHTMLIANSNGFSSVSGGHTISFGNSFNTDPGTPTDADIPPQ